jgi:hypothetical protein
MTTQCQRQTKLNKALNDCLRDYLETDPDIDAQTMLDALDDNRTDALGLWIKRSFNFDERIS